MIKSQNKSALPIDIFLYLLTTAPMISVPPVLPLAVNTSPKPAPHRQPPIMIDINGSSANIGFPAKSHSKNERDAEREITPNIVFNKNLNPNIFNATTSNATLIIK